MFEGIQGAPLQVHRRDALESTDQLDEPLKVLVTDRRVLVGELEQTSEMAHSPQALAGQISPASTRTAI